MKYPDAIFISDPHLTDRCPECRTDDYQVAQFRKWKFIRQVSQEFGECPVIAAGDVFDFWKPSPGLLRWALEILPKDLIVIPGNHDLPQHSLTLYPKCGVAVLEAAKRVIVPKEAIEFTGWSLHPLPFNGDLKTLNDSVPAKKKNHVRIAIAHLMAWAGRPPYPGAPIEGSAVHILKNLSNFDGVITGDNHKQFEIETENQFLINPGSLMRRTASQIDHQPALYLFASKGRGGRPEWERVPIPIRQGVVSREHIDRPAGREKNLEAFVRRLAQDEEVGISFETNLNRALKDPAVEKPIKEKVREYVGL